MIARKNINFDTIVVLAFLSEKDFQKNIEKTQIALTVTIFGFVQYGALINTSHTSNGMSIPAITRRRFKIVAVHLFERDSQSL